MMVITDSDLLILGLYIFVWMLLFFLGPTVSGLFAILGGIVGVVFATEVFRITADPILSIVVGGVAVVTMVIGIFEMLEDW